MLTISNKHTSRLVKAAKGWSDSLKSFDIKPEGMFGRVAIIETWAVTIHSGNIDFELDIPFDDDLEANEAEINIYNLSKTTIKNIMVNKPITIKAGYQGDMGVVFSGYVSKVKTKRQGCDKVTTIYALDSMDLKERKLADVTYAAGRTASYILRDLINRTKLPIAVFEPKRDWTYKDEVTINSGLMDSIRKYSEVCGISTWINKGKVYAMPISKGTNSYFVLSADTGLIDSPEEFEEEITAEDYKDTIKGYKLKMLLQHRVTTGSVIKVKSLEVNGEYRVRSGKHTFTESEAYTEVEVIS